MSALNNCHESWLETKAEADIFHQSTLRKWLIEDGYLPERAILPPCFENSGLDIINAKKSSSSKKPSKRSLATISLPKSDLVNRNYSVIHPNNYEYLVSIICSHWKDIRKILFHEDNDIYSYSFPIPIKQSDEDTEYDKRPSHFIYEWTKMAEEDLLIESKNYSIIAKTDISNFYPSVYTHSIEWAFEDTINKKEKGKELDEAVRLCQDNKSHGIPIGPSTSDIISEIILSSIDIKSSKEFRKNNLDVIVTRFKDDYRILANTQEDAKECLMIISKNLGTYHLHLNEKKTEICLIPDGLFRNHIRQYKSCVKGIWVDNKINHRDFFFILMDIIEIQKNNPSQSILTKFINSLFTKKKRTLKIRLPKNEKKKILFIKKLLSILIQLINIRPKDIGVILGAIENIILSKIIDIKDAKIHVDIALQKRLKKATKYNEELVSVWILYFSSALGISAVKFREIAKENTECSIFIKKLTSINPKKPKLFDGIPQNFMIGCKTIQRETTILEYLSLS